MREKTKEIVALIFMIFVMSVIITMGVISISDIIDKRKKEQLAYQKELEFQQERLVKKEVINFDLQSGYRLAVMEVNQKWTHGILIGVDEEDIILGVGAYNEYKGDVIIKKVTIDRKSVAQILIVKQEYATSK